MLDEVEKQHAAVLLNGLPLADLNQLTRTVTNRANFEISLPSKQDAIESILRYEESAKSLLSRKKITRGLLCQYLHWANVSFSVNADISTIRKIVIDYWNNSSPPKIYSCNNSINSGFDEVTSGACLPSSEETTSNLIANISLDSEAIPLLAKQFVAWFYSLINEDFWQRGGQVFGSDNLFSDCVVIVKYNDSQVQVVENDCEGGAMLLRRIVAEGRMLLQPNIEGIKSNQDCHGTVMVASGGTLHRPPDSCIGTFQQIFSLISDPLAQGNWKIKGTEIRINAGLLTIEDSPLAISMPD